MCVYMHMYVGECVSVCVYMRACVCVWSRWRVDSFGGGIHVCVEFAGQLRMMYTALQNGSDSTLFKMAVTAVP